MSSKPVMSMFATELDCLKARDKWYFEENAKLQQINSAQAAEIARLRQIEVLWAALLAEHTRADPVCQVVWKRRGDRSSSDWVNLCDDKDLVEHLAALQEAIHADGRTEFNPLAHEQTK